MDFALTERGNSDLVCQFWQQWNGHRELLYRCCLRLMNSNQTDAEDALSRAALKAWEKVQKFEGKITNFRAWSIKLTRNLCIDIIRERSRGATGVESIELVGDTQDMGMASSVKSPESCLEREERSIEIRRAIADLPETLRGTFILHFYEELSHTEIAKRQGISYNNVCRRIYVAKKKLKQKLSDYFLGTGEKVSVTAGKGHKLSTSRKHGEKQQRIESEEKKGLEKGTKQLPGDRATFDGHSISPSPHHPITLSPHHPITPSPHHPITPSQEEVVEIEKSESVDTSVEQGDNVGQTIQEVARVLEEVESDRFVEGEKQECVKSAVESREQVYREIQETATELTEVECVEVFEVEQDGCVESSVESYQIRRITISKSLQLKRSGRKQSQGFRRLLPMVAMTTVQQDFVSKDNRHIQKINNFIQPFLGTGRNSYQKNLFLYHPLSEKISSFLCVACCLSTVSKSYQKKSLACCLSRERSRWLRPYVMWRGLTGDYTKSGLISRLMGEMKLFPSVWSSLKGVLYSCYRSLMDTGG
ncbi:MAG: sigma-70 family RNA polymerase sigma factor [Okeania sp. SIO2C9]|uniref:RNA polymerase sigma factor n=1 Tax=Okeania sp. SIO2C9 TaxID=2607791 RepID=UPI0013C2914B|nr:sigma-70 family RNA polymerase sigma factor [Okeania sp. SIO2C9]NEQ72119.1 sigma-70 family RNA polymerase sigma factor [Okeania sp. SIO2C9]